MLGFDGGVRAQRRREDAGGPGADVSGVFAVDELALALVTTRHRVREQLGLAAALGNELSATGGLLSSGVIDGYQAWVIHDMISNLVEPDHIQAVETDILKRAPQLTGGQIRSRLAKLITAAEPGAFTVRHQRAMNDRRLSATPGGDGLDGMGSLWLSHAAVDIAAIDENITRLARAHIRTGDDRGSRGGWSFDTVRADVARDLLLGRHHTGPYDRSAEPLGEPVSGDTCEPEPADGSTACDTGETAVRLRGASR
jgi:hypothetical protein